MIEYVQVCTMLLLNLLFNTCNVHVITWRLTLSNAPLQPTPARSTTAVDEVVVWCTWTQHHDASATHWLYETATVRTRTVTRKSALTARHARMAAFASKSASACRRHATCHCSTIFSHHFYWFFKTKLNIQKKSVFYSFLLLHNIFFLCSFYDTKDYCGTCTYYYFISNYRRILAHLQCALNCFLMQFLHFKFHQLTWASAGKGKRGSMPPLVIWKCWRHVICSCL